MIATEIRKRLRDYFDILFRLLKLSKIDLLMSTNEILEKEKKIINLKKNISQKVDEISVSSFFKISRNTFTPVLQQLLFSHKAHS